MLSGVSPTQPWWETEACADPAAFSARSSGARATRGSSSLPAALLSHFGGQRGESE